MHASSCGHGKEQLCEGCHFLTDSIYALQVMCDVNRLTTDHLKMKHKEQYQNLPLRVHNIKLEDIQALTNAIIAQEGAKPQRILQKPPKPSGESSNAGAHRGKRTKPKRDSAKTRRKECKQTRKELNKVKKEQERIAKRLQDAALVSGSGESSKQSRHKATLMPVLQTVQNWRRIVEHKAQCLRTYISKQ